jgi:hypothetical protein
MIKKTYVQVSVLHDLQLKLRIFVSFVRRTVCLTSSDIDRTAKPIFIVYGCCWQIVERFDFSDKRLRERFTSAVRVGGT